jgi:hypothetical protein
MQLGTRWPVGATPPRLPDVVTRAIADVEAELEDIDTSSWRWTLTWLEGTPIVVLDDGTTIRYDRASDTTTITSADDDPED